MLSTMLRLTALTATLVLPTVQMATQAAQQPETAHVRFAHFSPTTPPITLTIDDNPTQMQEIGFGTISGWYELAPGQYGYQITGDDVTLNGQLEIGHDHWGTLVLTGTRERDSLAARLLDEDFSELPYGESRLRLFHGVDGLPPMDVFANDTPLLQYLTYPNGQDGYASIDIIANQYALRFVQNSGREMPVLDLGMVQLNNGFSHFIAMIGTPDAINYAQTSTDIHTARQIDHPALLLEQDALEAGTAHLRVAHFASGTGPLDVYIEGQRSTITNLSFAQVSVFVDLPTGTSTITLVPTGETMEATIINRQTIDLNRGSWGTIALIGAADNGSLQVQFFEEYNQPPPANQARVGVFQAIPGIAPVDLTLRDTSMPDSESITPVRLLGYPGVQGDNDGFESFTIVSGTYNVQIVSSANAEEVILDLPATVIQANRVYLIATLRADPPYYLGYTEIPATPTDD